LSRKKSSKEQSSNHRLALLLEKTASVLAFSRQSGNPNGRSLLRLIILSSISLSNVERASIDPILNLKTPKFRLFSLLNQIGKLCERIITWFMQTEATVRPYQLGCRVGVSPIDAARLAHDLFAVSATNKRPFAGIFLDIAKAYDRVHTGILCQKLSANPSISPWLL
jgi:hypothetical protein